jgi:hypothetical protein
MIELLDEIYAEGGVVGSRYSAEVIIFLFFHAVVYNIIWIGKLQKKYP